MLLKWMAAFPKGLETKSARGLVCAGKVRGSRRVLGGGPPDAPGLQPLGGESGKSHLASLDFWLLPWLSPAPSVGSKMHPLSRSHPASVWASCPLSRGE